MSVKRRLESSGIVLPEPPKPVGLYMPLKVVGDLVFVSGMLPVKENSLIAKGKVSSEVTVDKAKECARQVVLNLLAILDRDIGLERIDSCVRLNGYVASDEDFFDQPEVLNAASQLLNEVFGGHHTRVAIGVSVLPMNSPIEMDFILALKG